MTLKEHIDRAKAEHRADVVALLRTTPRIAYHRIAKQTGCGLSLVCRIAAEEGLTRWPGRPPLK